MSTWADDVNNYVRLKSHTAPPLEPIKRYVRTDASGRQSRDNRDFDIVTCTIKDTQQRGRIQQSAVQDMERHVTRAMDRDLSKSHHCYDIVTMSPKYGVSEDMVATVGGNQEPRGKRSIAARRFVNYDIVTNNEQRYANGEPVEVDPSVKPKIAKPPRVRDKRVTNIVSHQYTENHEERAERDRQKLIEQIEAKALKGRELNPITQQFNDAQQEEDCRRQKVTDELRQREIVKNHTYETSGIVKRSDGHAFDVVTNHVYNPEFVLAIDKSRNKGLLQRAELRQKWEHQRDVEEVVRDGDLVRAAGRVKNDRQKEEFSRGYDVITGQDFVVCDREDNKAKPHLLHAAEQLKKPTTMDILKGSLNKKTDQPAPVLRETGPRTSHERVFHVPSSKVNAGVATYEGRKKLLLPTLEKAAGVPQTGAEFSCTV